MRDDVTQYFDTLETRSADARAADQLTGLQAQIDRVLAAPESCLPGIGKVESLDDLAKLPVLRKSQLSE